MRWFAVAYLIIGMAVAGYVLAANERTGMVPTREMGDEILFTLVLWPVVIGMIAFVEVR